MGTMTDVAKVDQLAGLDATLCEVPTMLPRQINNWTCGYENIAALLHAAVVGRIFKSVPTDVNAIVKKKAPLPEGMVLKIQELIDTAWREGYDTESAETLMPIAG